uniref:ADP-ribosylglycohydrolase n=1 Tax=Hemiselmis andersenii TaxID=464988 RepID=A0A6T8MTR4_HEMAN
MPGVHPHRALSTGANTLTGHCARLLVRSLVEKQSYDRDYFLDLYIDFMLHTPDKDTYIDALHVEFFERYSRGNKPYYSAGMGKAATEAVSLGLVMVTPLLVYLSVQEELRDALIAKGEGRYSFYNLQYSARHASPLVVENSMQDVVYQFVELFFRTETMQMYAMQWTTLMKKLLLGFPAKAELWDAARKVDVELDALIPLPDDEVVGGCYSPCNLMEHAYPCILYIAAKYVDDPEGAIVVSANLGGDSTNRTALVAALMGAIHGYTEIPLRWREKVQDVKRLDADCQALVLLGMYLKP